MTISLPVDTILPPKWRILRKKTWDSAWEILPTDQLLGTSTVSRLGYFHIDELWVSCIPEPGQAMLRFEMGLIDGKYVGVDEATGQATDQTDLTANIIRIQCAPDLGDGSTPAWRTVWLGGVEMQRDEFAPGSEEVRGTRFYNCLDLLAFYTKRWQMDRHGVYVASSNAFFTNCYGHPGYNYTDWNGRIIGNRAAYTYYSADAAQQQVLPWINDNLDDTTKAAFQANLFCHTHAGNGVNNWTDKEAVNHALAATRPPKTPFFYVKTDSYTATLVGTVNAWPIQAGQKVYEFLSQIFRRQRGRGVAFLSWDDDSGNPTGEIAPYILIRPQDRNDTTWTAPDGTSGTIYGANTCGTTVTVDLVGDHRNVAANFHMGDRFQHGYQYVETVGEPIQVLATLDFTYGGRQSRNSAQERWSLQDETDFSTYHTIDATQVKAHRHDPIWQLYGLNLAWDGLAGNGEAAAPYNAVDYRCDDSGNVVVPGTPANEQPYKTSPVLAKVMDDLPIYMGYNYSVNPPVPYDSSVPDQSPGRRPILCMYRGAVGRFHDVQMTYSCQVSNSPHGIFIRNSDDISDGTRLFSNTASYGGELDYKKLVFTVGIELPHRVRMGSGSLFIEDDETIHHYTQNSATRKLTVFIPGLHLWLASPDAIWDIQGTETSDGQIPQRNAALGVGSTPGVLRDDRDRLAIMHALACTWYLSERRNVTWQLRACGFLPSFTNTTDASANPPTTTAVSYPTLGQVVTTMAAGGQTYLINTPITKINFTNHGNGITTWQTDWCDLDFR